MKTFEYLQEVKGQYINIVEGKKQRYNDAENALKDAEVIVTDLEGKYTELLHESAQTTQDMSKDIDTAFSKLQKARDEVAKKKDMLGVMKGILEAKEGELPFTGTDVANAYQEYKAEFTEQELKPMILECLEMQQAIKDKIKFVREQAEQTQGFLNALNRQYGESNFISPIEGAYHLYQDVFGKNYPHFQGNPLDVFFKRN